MSEDRIHPATPHRRKQAREQGNVTRSQELASTAVLLGSLATLLFFGSGVGNHLITQMHDSLGGKAWLHLEMSDVTELWNRTVVGLAMILLPILVLTMLWGVLSTLLQTGFLFRPEQVTFDPSRIQPLQGLGRLFSLQSGARFALGIVKLAAVGTVAWYSVSPQRDAIAGAVALEPPQLARFMTEIVLTTSLKVGGALLAVALCDYGYQWWRRERDLRMTAQEVRDELRDLQGNPQTTAHRRAVQRRGFTTETRRHGEDKRG